MNMQSYSNNDLEVTISYNFFIKVFIFLTMLVAGFESLTVSVYVDILNMLYIDYISLKLSKIVNIVFY